MALFCGVDVGGTKIAAALVNDRGEIIGHVKRPTPQKAAGRQISRHLIDLLGELLERQHCEPSQLTAIGIGIPGVVSPDGRSIVVTPNIRLSGYPLVRDVEAALHRPVVLGNDVNLGLLGEQWLGAAKSVANVIGIFPGTGVGGAIIIDGHLVTGAQGAAAELGHMIIDIDNPAQSAGVNGTLEALASRRAIEREIREAVAAGTHSSITETAGKNLEIIKSKMLRQALDQQDELVTSVFDRVCLVLGKACVSLRHIFNPDMIIFGGGVIEACGEYILPRVRKISEADPFFKKIDHCRIVPSALGDDAVILGAVALARQPSVSARIKSAPYPKIKTSKQFPVQIAGRVIKSDCFIRADGKVKMIDGQKFFRKLIFDRRLDEQVARRFCRKNPDVFIIAQGKRRMIIERDARMVFKQAGVALEVRSFTEGLKRFSLLERRKALLLFK